MATGKIEDNPILRYQAQQAMTERDTNLRKLDMEKQQAEQDNLSTEKLNAIRAKGQADEMVQTAVSGIAAKTTAANDIAANFLGLNPDAANYRLAKLSAEREDAYEKTKISGAEVARKQGLNIMSDPLGFINAQFTLPSDIAAHNYYVDRYDAADGEFINITQAGTAVGTANKALQATTSAAMAEGQLKQVKVQTEIALIDAKAESIKLHTDGITKLQGMDEAMLRNAASAVQIDETVKNNELRRAQMSLSMEQMQLVRTERLAKAKTAEAIIEEEDNLVKYYNLAAQANYGTILPKSMLLSKLRRNDEASKDIIRMVGIGEDLALNGDRGKTGVPIARTSGEAAKLHMAINARPVGTDASTINFLAQSYNEAASDPTVAAQKDVGARTNAISTIIESKAKAEMKGIRGDRPNIYAAPPVSALLSSVPALSKYPFITKTLADKASADPTASVKDEDIIAAAKVAIVNDPNQLAEISKAVSLYYAAAINYNNSAKGFAENAVPIQKGYNAVLGEGFLGRDQTIDLSSEVNVKTLLMTNLIKSGRTAKDRSGLMLGISGQYK